MNFTSTCLLSNFFCRQSWVSKKKWSVHVCGEVQVRQNALQPNKINLRGVDVKHLHRLRVNCHGQLCLPESNAPNAYTGTLGFWCTLAILDTGCGQQHAIQNIPTGWHNCTQRLPPVITVSKILQSTEWKEIRWWKCQTWLQGGNEKVRWKRKKRRAEFLQLVFFRA